MPTLYLMRGLPAAGKSTYSLKLISLRGGNVKRICKDDLRLMLDGSQKYGARYLDEAILNYVVDQMAESYLKGLFDVILDETMVSEGRYESLKLLAEINDWNVETIVLDTSEEECILRDGVRPNPVGRDVIRSYAEQFRKEGINV